MGRASGISRMWPVALAFAAAAVLALAGCGWEPVYGTATGGASAPAQVGLAQTTVALIPERNGQLLRQALQARLDRGSGGVEQRYELAVNGLSISGEPLAIQRDNTTSRVRLVGVAPWSLTSLGPVRRTLASGQARVVDGYNVIDQQYFASDLDSEAVQRRMIDALAEQITLQIAMYFRRQPSGS
jgi:LPS-assembly lipoprotein